MIRAFPKGKTYENIRLTHPGWRRGVVVGRVGVGGEVGLYNNSVQFWPIRLFAIYYWVSKTTKI